MDRPQLIRRLRIAATVFFAVVAIGICVLWVRSYRVADAVYTGRTLATVRERESPTAGADKHLCDEKRILGELPWRSTDSDAWPTRRKSKFAPRAFSIRLCRITGFITGCTFPILHLCCYLELLPRCRHGCQFAIAFSLRTLLIATTVVAVVLGLGVWAAG